MAEQGDRTHGELTTPVSAPGESAHEIQGFVIHVEKGPSYASTSDRGSRGAQPLNQFVIEDPTVSCFHCEIRLEPEGLVVHDLHSRNRTVVDGVTDREAVLRAGSTLRLGNSVMRVETAA